MNAVRNVVKHPDLVRRGVLTGATLLLIAPPLFAAPTTVEMWKGPQCSCCMDWVVHLRSKGFSVKVHDDGNTEARARLRVPLRHASCHTAVVGGYAIEGHVPAREIRRLLAERPKAIGLAVPAMHIGSPGMDGPAYGGRHDPYDVLLLLSDGSTSIYQHYA